MSLGGLPRTFFRTFFRTISDGCSLEDQSCNGRTEQAKTPPHTRNNMEEPLLSGLQRCDIENQDKHQQFNPPDWTWKPVLNTGAMLILFAMSSSLFVGSSQFHMSVPNLFYFFSSAAPWFPFALPFTEEGNFGSWVVQPQFLPQVLRDPDPQRSAFYVNFLLYIALLILLILIATKGKKAKKTYFPKLMGIEQGGTCGVKTPIYEGKEGLEILAGWKGTVMEVEETGKSISVRFFAHEAGAVQRKIFEHDFHHLKFMSSPLLTWMLVQEACEFLLLLFASFQGFMEFETGLFWELWVEVFLLWSSFLLVEHYQVGTISPTSAAIWFIPALSTKLTLFAYKLQGFLCLRAAISDPSLIAFVLGMASFLVTINAGVQLYRSFKPACCGAYFACNPQPDSVLDTYVLQQATYRIAKGFKLFVLQQAEQATHPSKVQQTLLNHIPHGILAVLMSEWHGHLAGILMFNLLSGVSKAIGLPIGRLYVLNSRSKWGDLANLKGKFQAMQMYVCSRTFGRSHPFTLKSMTEYSVSLDKAGRLDEALALKKQVMDLRKAALGETHPETLTSMGTYSVSLDKAGRLDEALALSKEVMDLRKAALGETHLDTLKSMGNYSASLDNAGRLDEALALNKQVIDLRKAALGENHPETLKSMSNYSVSLDKAGRWDEALALNKQVMDLRKAALGETHPDTLTSMSNYSVSLGKVGRWDEALALKKQVMDLRKAAWGETHPRTLDSMSNYSASLAKAGRLDEALALYKEVMFLRKAALGETHPETLTSMSNYSVCLNKAGRLDEALALKKEVMDLRKAALGETHPDTLTSMGNYSVSLDKAGRLDEALSLNKQVMDLRKAALGETHPRTHDSMSNYSVSLDKAGRLDEALALYKQVMDLRKAALGETHPDTLTSMSNYSMSLNKAGRLDEAMSLKRQVMDLRKAALGETIR